MNKKQKVLTEIFKICQKKNVHTSGWAIDPITDEAWRNISENEFNKIMKLIERCLYKHQSEFEF